MAGKRRAEVLSISFDTLLQGPNVAVETVLRLEAECVFMLGLCQYLGVPLLIQATNATYPEVHFETQSQTHVT